MLDELNQRVKEYQNNFILWQNWIGRRATENLVLIRKARALMAKLGFGIFFFKKLFSWKKLEQSISFFKKLSTGLFYTTAFLCENTWLNSKLCFSFTVILRKYFKIIIYSKIFKTHTDCLMQWCSYYNLLWDTM